jgi:polyhydroxyalkanoate synthesis regulator phasin
MRDAGFLNRLRSRGQEVLTQVSAELGQNKRFMQAMAGAMHGKELLEEAVGRVLRQMNVPSRSEWKRAVARIEALEKEVAALKRGRARAGSKRRAARRAARKPAKAATSADTAAAVTPEVAE